VILRGERNVRNESGLLEAVDKDKRGVSVKRIFLRRKATKKSAVGGVLGVLFPSRYAPCHGECDALKSEEPNKMLCIVLVE
jgi:hypothetical protein